jgi:hypothetical protein
MRLQASRWTVLSLLAMVFCLAVTIGAAQADQMNKKTIVTFSEATQVPGMTLPAGTYVFKLMDSSSDKHVVQIWNESGTKLVTTVLSISTSEPQPAGKVMLTYAERPANEPQAVKEWWYPGDNAGQEFVYPKSRAVELSQVNNVTVPSTETEEAYAPPPAPVAEPEAASAPVAEPAPVEQPVAQAETPAPAPAPMEQEAPKALPQTASELPLFGLIGLLSLAAFAMLRVSRRRLS